MYILWHCFLADKGCFLWLMRSLELLQLNLHNRLPLLINKQVSMHGLVTALPISQLVHAHNDNYCGVVKEDPWAKHFMVGQSIN